MPNYDEIIKLSQENVYALSEKLKDLDKLYQDIVSIKTKSEVIPLAFEENFQKITEGFKAQSESFSVAINTYLDGNNSLLTSKFKDFTDKISELDVEITRLVSTDFTASFNELQNVFIEKTRTDLAVELTKIGEKTKDFQIKIEALSVEIKRIENVDLEKHFDKLQKTLSDIFSSIATVNQTILNQSQTLNSVLQKNSELELLVKKQSELIDLNKLEIAKSIEKQDLKLSEIITSTNEIKLENGELKKELNQNKILIFGLIFISVVSLVLQFIK
ncbi:MAG: hypothetical protein RLZZ175_2552 [Bacteroidota bacterium]|jgi:hypothetical protein